jgi:hypothetical protein
MFEVLIVYKSQYKITETLLTSCGMVTWHSLTQDHTKTSLNIILYLNLGYESIHGRISHFEINTLDIK